MVYRMYTLLDIAENKQANQERIKEIEQDKNSDPENPPDCSQWEKN